MKRKDTLAAGALKATFQGGVGDIGVDRNLSKEPRNKEIKLDAPKAVIQRGVRPLGTTILVRRAEAKPLSILIVETVEQEKPAEGIVLDRGVEVTTVEKGDEIVFGKYSGAEFPLNGETLLLMDIAEVKGILYDKTPEKKSRFTKGE